MTLTLFSLLMILFGLGLAIGVVLAVGALLFFQVSLDINTILFSRCNSFLSFQLRSIVRNQTGIEEWIMEKADYRLRDSDEKFVNPYDLVRTECFFFLYNSLMLCFYSCCFQGRWGNFRFVVRPACYSTGDGIDWPLREGAGKYDMTVSVNNDPRNPFSILTLCS